MACANSDRLKTNYLRRNKLNYQFCTGGEASNCTILTVSPPIYATGEKKPEKKFRASTGFEPVTSVNTGAMLYQLSYEATHWEPGHFLWVLSFP